MQIAIIILVLLVLFGDEVRSTLSLGNPSPTPSPGPAYYPAPTAPPAPAPGSSPPFPRHAPSNEYDVAIAVITAGGKAAESYFKRN